MKRTKNGGDKSSLIYLTKQYGEEIAKQIYEKRRELRSLKMKGRNSPMKGRKHKTSSIEKIKNSVSGSEYHKSITGKKMSDEKLKKHKESMSGVFSLEWFIKKYGEEKGLELYRKRCVSISKTTFFKIYNKEQNKRNYSKKSQELFWKIYKELNLKNFNVYFAELNNEYSCGTNSNFDFVFLDKKKIIEFNGDFWHANPKIYDGECLMEVQKIKAKDVWEKDKSKNSKVEDKGFEILTVWESDYIRNKKNVINNCIEFLIK
jgi:very-short-patch-repair endonuclease